MNYEDMIQLLDRMEAEFGDALEDIGADPTPRQRAQRLLDAGANDAELLECL